MHVLVCVEALFVGSEETRLEELRDTFVVSKNLIHVGSDCLDELLCLGLLSSAASGDDLTIQLDC